MEHILPNGLVDENGMVIRSIELRDLSGPEEDMLRDKRELRDGNIIAKLLRRSIVRIGEYEDPKKIDDLFGKRFLLADMTYLLIRLRQQTTGEDLYAFDATCPTCDTMRRKRIDLSELRIDEQKQEYRGAERIKLTVDIRPPSKRGTKAEQKDLLNLEIRPLYVSDLSMLETIKVDYGSERGTRELALQLLRVNDAKPLPSYIKTGLSWAARTAIREAIDKTSGGVDTELLCECKRCERSWKMQMPIEMSSFFFPTEDSFENASPAKPFRSSGGTSSSSQPDGDGAESPSTL